MRKITQVIICFSLLTILAVNVNKAFAKDWDSMTKKELEIAKEREQNKKKAFEKKKANIVKEFDDVIKNAEKNITDIDTAIAKKS